MSTKDWLRVISQAASLRVRMVQFIGGEPTLHPDLPELIEHALTLGVDVEVFSNLVHVSATLWDVFRRPGVSLATSWYTDDAAAHAQIVGGRPTHRMTLGNMTTARELGIPVRAGLVRVDAQQRIGPAIDQLTGLGIERIGVDDVRGVGRGAAGRSPDVSALCGRCASGRLAIVPSGAAYPCVFGRWPALQVGNALTQSLEEIISGPQFASTRGVLQAEFDGRPSSSTTACSPDGDNPCAPHDRCGPDRVCGPDTVCGPAIW
jgi:MoaA/NifB/PqqE/SkfB family radical SAM enzyme